MKKKISNRIILLTLIIAGIGTSNLLQGQETAKVTNVEVLKLFPQNMSVFVSYAGYLKPFDRVVVKTEIDGTIEKINFEEGKKVEEEQVLVHVSTKRLELQQQIANSNFNQAETEYNTQKMYFDSADSQVVQLSADTEIPESEMITQADLESKKVSEQISIKQLELQVKVNESNYSQALSEYKKQKSLFDKKISNSTTMEKYKNQMEVSKWVLERSKLDFERARINEEVGLDIKLKHFQRENRLRKERSRIQANIAEHISTKRLGMQVRIAETEYEHSLSDFQTQKSLFNNNLINADALERFHNTLKLSKIKLQLAKSAYVQSKIQDNSRLKTYHHAMQNAKLGLALANLDLEKSKVKAPFAGVVNKKFAQLGEFVQKGQSLLEIMDLSRVLAQVNIPEKEVRFAKPGKKVVIKIDAFPNSTFRGKIRTLGLEADLKSRSFPVEIEIDNPKGELYSGLMTRVEMLSESRGNQVIVPRHVVLDREKGTIVFVEKQGKVQLRYVRVGQMIRDKVQITSGLKFGERLVIVGQNLLADNEAVNVVKTTIQQFEGK